MTDLQNYVDGLFRHQPLTPEIQDLKEEIVSNMMAKRDDLMAQGMDAESATQKAKESLPAVDFLIDGNQLTDVGTYRMECMQSVLLNCILFWIFSLSLLFVGPAFLSYVGGVLVLAAGCTYAWMKYHPVNGVAVLSVTASERRRKLVWVIWGLFFLVSAGMMAAVTFGSNLWFGRPVSISGPYEMASVAMRFYLPLLTIFVPLTFGSFSRFLTKNRKGGEDE